VKARCFSGPLALPLATPLAQASNVSGDSQSRRRDFDALERRRMQAVKLLRKGFNQSEVARRVKVCSQTVSRWNLAVSKQGEEALKKATEEQAEIRERLPRNALLFDFEMI